MNSKSLIFLYILPVRPSLISFSDAVSHYTAMGIRGMASLKIISNIQLHSETLQRFPFNCAWYGGHSWPTNNYGPPPSSTYCETIHHSKFPKVLRHCVSDIIPRHLSATILKENSHFSFLLLLLFFPFCWVRPQPLSDIFPGRHHAPTGPNNTSSRKRRGQHVQMSVNSQAVWPIFAHDLSEAFSRGHTIGYQRLPWGSSWLPHNLWWKNPEGIFKCKEKALFFQVAYINSRHKLNCHKRRFFPSSFFLVFFFSGNTAALSSRGKYNTIQYTVAR